MSENKNVCYDVASKLLMLYMMQLPTTVITVLITIAMTIAKISSTELARSFMKAVIGSLAWGPVFQSAIIIAAIIVAPVITSTICLFTYLSCRIPYYVTEIIGIIIGVIVIIVPIWLLGTECKHMAGILEQLQRTHLCFHQIFNQINEFMGYFWEVWTLVEIVGIGFSITSMWLSTRSSSSQSRHDVVNGSLIRRGGLSQGLGWAFVVAAFLLQVIYLIDLGLFFCACTQGPILLMLRGLCPNNSKEEMCVV